MSDAFYTNLPAIITAIGLLVTSVFSFWTHLKVGKQTEKIEVLGKHTNGMIEKIEILAKKEGKAEQKAETASAMPNLPIVVTAAPAPTGAMQEEIAKWVAHGYVLGKAVREANGVKDKEPGKGVI